MSFRCQSCDKVGSKPNRIVVQKRRYDHHELRENYETGVVVPTFIGVGDQIVEEKNICDKCIKA